MKRYGANFKLLSLGFCPVIVNLTMDRMFSKGFLPCKSADRNNVIRMA